MDLTHLLRGALAAPIALAVAWCSSTIDVYWTGMAQPAKSTIRAPWLACQSWSGVRLGPSVVDMAHRAGKD